MHCRCKFIITDPAPIDVKKLSFATAAVIVCGDGGANRLKDLNLSEAEEAKCVCVDRCHHKDDF